MTLRPAASKTAAVLLLLGFTTACSDAVPRSPTAPEDLVPSFARVPTYTEIELGAGRAQDINNRGQVALWQQVGHKDLYHAAVWDDGEFTPLGADLYDPPMYRFQMEISARGDVVGAMNENLDREMHAFWWGGGKVVDLGPGHARGLNERGQVVGLVPRGQTAQAALWENGLLVRTAELNSLFHAANAINARGEIVGSGRVAPEGSRTFIWVGDQITPVDLEASSNGLDINQRGEITGTLTTEEGKTFAYVWNGGKPSVFAGPGVESSSSAALNNRGQLAGTIYDGTLTRAAMWDNGTLVLLSKGAGGAMGINVRGDVVGYKGDAQSGYVAVLWKRR